MKNFIYSMFALLMLFAGQSNAAALSATDFGSIQTDVIGTIGVAAAIGVAIMVVGLGWDVGMALVKKFVKRGAR
ncbi:MAG: hypothetical protein KGZ69_14840 [Methylomonas sp.]|nr:hypothetical protein [Methylomonas sp.]